MYLRDIDTHMIEICADAALLVLPTVRKLTACINDSYLNDVRLHRCSNMALALQKTLNYYFETGYVGVLTGSRFITRGNLQFSQGTTESGAL